MNESKGQNKNLQYQTNNYAEDNEDNEEDHDQLVSPKSQYSYFVLINQVQVPRL